MSNLIVTYFFFTPFSTFSITLFCSQNLNICFLAFFYDKDTKLESLAEANCKKLRDVLNKLTILIGFLIKINKS